MNPFVFANPTRLYYGKGQIGQHLATEVKRHGSKVLLVYGGGSIKRFGLYEKVVHALTAVGVPLFELSGVEPNPRLTTVHKGVALCKEHAIDLVLAVGGGSVLDAAKAIAAGACYEGDVWDFYATRKRPEAAIALGTILTHAATGSEMNSGGVITNWETQEKLSSSSPFTFPRFSFCDPENTYTVLREQTVYGIVDMFSHVLEGYFSQTPGTPLQERLCEAVMQTIIEQADAVLEHPDDYAAREAIMYCGTMALNGMITMGMQGDWATHGIEHEVSAYYDIPHGGGLAILFPHWMDAVIDAGAFRFAQLAERVFHICADGKTEREHGEAGIAAVKRFFAHIGAPGRLDHYQISSEHFADMARHVTRGGPIGKFKALDADTVEAILRASL